MPGGAPVVERMPPRASILSMTTLDFTRSHFSATRLVAMGVILVAVAVPVGALTSWAYGPAIGWAAACAFFILTAVFRIARFDPDQTREHARQEDPGRAMSDLLLTVASIASLLAVFVLLSSGRSAHGTAAVLLALTAVLCIALSWGLIHTLYMLRYARMYYSDPVGGIDFNTDVPPRYVDFAYLAFDLGMTYQVSDTSVSTSALRGVILRHTLLSYLFGSVVLASVVNLVAGLG